ncbi:hypothetical protein VM98_04405 [Streptomyces rubellomurinus subsp. indigoferus]|nr:hypothetical protein VM98_04405 [Streptomyces rubellomurinus subsp. indigoferus]
MTTPTIGAPAAPSAALRAVLQLYPAGYRRERGEELAAVFADTTAHAGRSAVAREVFDLALYGLRVRAGLTGSTAAGRLLALVAPMIAGAVAGAALVPWLADPDRVTFLLTWNDSLSAYAEVFLQPVGAMLLVVAAALGRWTAARGLALFLGVLALGELGGAFVDSRFADLWWPGYIGMATLPFVFAALLLLAAPADLLPRPSLRSGGLVVASVVAGALLETAQRWDDTNFPVDRQWFVLMLAAPLVLALTALRGRRVPAAVGVAVLAVTAPGSLFNIWRESRGISHLAQTAAPVVIVLAMVALVAYGLGRRRPERVGV